MTSSLTQAQTARQAAATRRAEFLLECFQRQEQLYKDRLSDVTTASERAELLMEDALLQLEVQRLQKVRALEERLAQLGAPNEQWAEQHVADKIRSTVAPLTRA